MDLTTEKAGSMHYDIVGDIHGCSKTLAALLDKLGYTKRKPFTNIPRARPSSSAISSTGALTNAR